MTDSTQTPQAPAIPPTDAPAFDAARVQRDLMIDATLRTVAGLGFFGVIISVFVLLPDATWGSALILALVVASWLSVNAINATVVREASAVDHAVAQGHPQVAEKLDELLRRRPLIRAVRLTLVQQQAQLALRRGRFAEAVAICRTLVALRGEGAARWDANQRASLMLTWAEAALASGWLYEAWSAITMVHHGMPRRAFFLDDHDQSSLDLTLEMRLLAVQTEYEVRAGLWTSAIDRLKDKARLTELMPPLIAGQCHAWWGQAATALGEAELARWCWQRASLLLPNDAASALYYGRSSPNDPLRSGTIASRDSQPAPVIDDSPRLGEHLDTVL